MQSENAADFIVVGLGLAGLASCYSLAKAGYDVLGIEQFTESGSIGTSSSSYTRMFNDSIPSLSERIPYDYTTWRSLEIEFGRQILRPIDGYDIAPKDSVIMSIKQKMRKSKVYTSSELSRQYSALKLPDDYVALDRPESYLINVRNALLGLKEAALKQGAKLRYNLRMSEFDVNSKQIKAAERTLHFRKELILTTGPYTQDLIKEEDVKTVEVENWVIEDRSGLPQSFVLHTRDGEYIYVWPYKFQDKLRLKIGFSFERNIKKMAKLMREFIPSKLSATGLSIPCFRVNRKGYDDFQAYKKNGVVCCYGFTGQGFKHGPSIGEDVRKFIEQKWPRSKL